MAGALLGLFMSISSEALVLHEVNPRPHNSELHGKSRKKDKTQKFDFDNRERRGHDHNEPVPTVVLHGVKQVCTE